ncbi:MAG: hypothetical protein LBV72_00245 [Tannerella sp.]|jgi:hypothetical protein|nr:hypothetical protein [Tannerella sp.]
MNKILERAKAKKRDNVDIDSLLKMPKGLNRWGLVLIFFFISSLLFISSKVHFRSKKIFICNLYSELSYDNTSIYYCSLDINKEDSIYFDRENIYSIFLNDSCIFKGKHNNLERKVCQDNKFRLTFIANDFFKEKNICLPATGKIYIQQEKNNLLDIITTSVYKSIF